MGARIAPSNLFSINNIKNCIKTPKIVEYSTVNHIYPYNIA